MADQPIRDKGEWLFRQLAGYFMSLDPGDSVDSIRKLAAGFNASIGLVSERITELENTKLIRIDRRGQLGSFLIEQSIGGLWNAAVQSPLVIAHTLPSNRVYEGLNTGLKKCFEDLEIETYFVFIRGSRTRLTALREKRCNVAIMSHFSAEGLSDLSESTVFTLPPGSFVGSHRVFYRKGISSEFSKSRIAIDNDSFDQAELSRLEFIEEMSDWVMINFMNIQRCLLENTVDSAIWTAEDMNGGMSDEIESRSLSKKTIAIVANRNTMASLVVRADDLPTRILLQKGVNTESVLQTQKEVIRGNLIPQY